MTDAVARGIGVGRLFVRAARTVASYFEVDESARQSHHGGAPRPDAGALPPGADAAEIPIAELSHLIREARDVPGAATGAGLYVLGLDDLKRRLGDRWPQVAGKVRSLVRMVIERHLTDGEFYVETDADSFLLILPGLEEADARLKLALVSEKLSKLLVGADGQPIVQLQTSVTDLRDLPAKGDAATMLIAGLERARGARAPEPGPARSPADELQFIYCPLWYRERAHVTTYLCIPALLRGERLVTGHALADLGDKDLSVGHIDVLTLRRAAVEEQQAQKAGRRYIMTAPVHVRTLQADATRVRFLQECWRVPEEIRKRIVLELCGHSPHAPVEMLEDAVAALKPVARAVMVRTGLNTRHLPRLRRVGAFAVGAEASASTEPEDVLIRKLDMFAGQCSDLGLSSYVHGIPTLSLLTAAVGAQFTYIGGDPVGVPVDHPADSYALNLLSMYTARLQAS